MTGNTATDRPLATLFVMTYNQEKYVRDAVEGAFAQTYQPLEIVLSDDCGNDATFEIMEKMAAAYDGPHKIVLNRNSHNLGITAHIDFIMTLSHGELIVESCGDDVCFPERVECLADLWEESGRTAKVLHSSVQGIDSDGNPTQIIRPPQSVVDGPEPLNIVQNNLYIIGATEAWTREVYEVFGPLAPLAILDDRPMAFRGSLLGGLVFVNRPLVYYRTGGVSTNSRRLSGQQYLYGTRLRYMRWFASSYRSYLRDMELIAFADRDTCRDYCNERLSDLDFEIGLAESSHLQRVARLPEALRWAIDRRSAEPLKQTIKYIFDWPYMLYLDTKHALLRISGRL